MKVGRYKYYQPNKMDVKDEQGDCTIRGLTKFFDVSWLDAFDMLVTYARRKQRLINSIDNIKELLKDRAVNYVSIYEPKKKNKVTVEKFARDNAKGGKFLLYVRAGYSTHIVAVEDGYYYDTWDCGDRIVYGYWRR